MLVDEIFVDCCYFKTNVKFHGIPRKFQNFINLMLSVKSLKFTMYKQVL